MDRNRSHVGIVFRAQCRASAGAILGNGERISPGHVISSIKRGSGSLTFCQRCRIVPSLPLLPLGGVPYRPSHCTDSINDAINDSYRYITRDGNYERAELPGVRLPLLPLPRTYSWNKLAGKVATNDSRPRWNRADVSISMLSGLQRPRDPLSPP